jgi:hypothetical protein
MDKNNRQSLEGRLDTVDADGVHFGEGRVHFWGRRFSRHEAAHVVQKNRSVAALHNQTTMYIVIRDTLNNETDQCMDRTKKMLECLNEAVVEEEPGEAPIRRSAAMAFEGSDGD